MLSYPSPPRGYLPGRPGQIPTAMPRPRPRPAPTVPASELGSIGLPPRLPGGASPKSRTAPVIRGQSPEPVGVGQPPKPARRPRVMPTPEQVAVVQPQEPARRPLVMPTPKQLGLRTAPPVASTPPVLTPPTATSSVGEAPGSDSLGSTKRGWLVILRELDALGMQRFEFAPHGKQYRFVCELANQQRIEVVGPSKQVVLEAVLRRAQAARQ